MTIKFAQSSDIGMVREENEDFSGRFPENSPDPASPEGHLFVVADGMGGHNAGRTASEMAVRALAAEYYSAHDGTAPECLRRAFLGANKSIYSRSRESREFEGMGTTCVALAIRDERAYVAHVGDSRAYRITGGNIERLTGDHSVVAEMVRKGILTEEEAKVHPQRSHLYRALGVRPELEVDLQSDIDLRENDHFLLCTDGLYGYVTDAEMHEVVTSKSPEEACRQLVRVANARGGLDNITVQIIRIGG